VFIYQWSGELEGESRNLGIGIGRFFFFFEAGMWGPGNGVFVS